jgi:flagellar protein FlaI
MATDEADGSPAGEFDGAVDEAGAGDDAAAAVVGEYTWAEYLEEYGTPGDADALYENVDEIPGQGRWDDGSARPDRDDWDRVDHDPTTVLGFHPTDAAAVVGGAGAAAEDLREEVYAEFDLDDVPCVEGFYTWDAYAREFHDGGSFDREAALGHDPDQFEETLGAAGAAAERLSDLVDRKTVDVREELDEDGFFRTGHGTTTVVNRYDLEKSVPDVKKLHFREEERYWVNKPHSFVVIFHSTKENEKKYYVVEPYQNRIEEDLQEFLTGKLRTSIKYSDESIVPDEDGEHDGRLEVIERETLKLLERYDLFSRRDVSNLELLTESGVSNGGDEDDGGLIDGLREQVGLGDGADGEATNGEDAASAQDGAARTNGEADTEAAGIIARLMDTLGWGRQREVEAGTLEGMSARPEPAVLEEDREVLSEYQVDKLLYYLKRDFIGYERIDGIKHDINVEDISCDGYNSPVFVYHSDYEQIITNVYHGEDELDDFVVKLAQRSGKGISKRRPQVDATLPDGSRAQLTLGKEVSDHGTNYTIRQFKDVPFTPVDLINWKTFSLEEMAFLWLCIENNKSLIFAGGTASGKTTSLNAVSLFIPSNAKIVSIEDTREVELPQRNWVASVTRPSFSDDEKGDVDEFDLLEAALRQRPDYIVMGEVRGEEGRTLFQVMSTGHTTYTTFHADSVGEVLKRFTTDPINVSKTMFTALDLVSIQTSTRVSGNKVRRNKVLTEINHYDAENDEINVQDVYQWQAETDEFLKMGTSNTLSEIMFDRGWAREKVDRELFKRRVVLAYLIDRGLNTYTQVAATFQAFINDQETILTLMARDELERSLEDLREMESVLIDIEPEKEAMVPRPDPDDEMSSLAEDLLSEAEDELFPEYRDRDIDGLADALSGMADPEDVVVDAPDRSALAAGEEPGLDEGVDEAPALSSGPGDGAGEAASEPSPDADGAAPGSAEGAEAGVAEPATDAGYGGASAGAASVEEEMGSDAADGDGGVEAADAPAGDTDSSTPASAGGPSDAGGAESDRVPSLDVDAETAGDDVPTLDGDDIDVDAGVPSLDEDGEGPGGVEADTGDGLVDDADVDPPTQEGDGADPDADDGGETEAEADDEWGFGGFTGADPQEDE